MAVTKTDLARIGLSGLVRAERAKKKAPTRTAELGARAEQLAERASSSLAGLAQKTAEMAPAPLRDAPDTLKRQLGAGTALIAARLPHEAPSPSGPLEKAKASLPGVVPAVTEKVLPPARLAAAKLDNRRILGIAAGALVLSLVTGLGVRFFLRRKKHKRLESIDELADKAEAGENPIRYSAPRDGVAVRNGVSPVARPDRRS